jgi:hypothetical protein
VQITKLLIMQFSPFSRHLIPPKMLHIRVQNIYRLTSRRPIAERTANIDIVYILTLLAFKLYIRLVSSYLVRIFSWFQHTTSSDNNAKLRNTMLSSIFWNINLSSLLKIKSTFGGIFRFQFQGRRINTKQLSIKHISSSVVDYLEPSHQRPRKDKPMVQFHLLLSWSLKPSTECVLYF